MWATHGPYTMVEAFPATDEGYAQSTTAIAGYIDGFVNLGESRQLLEEEILACHVSEGQRYHGICLSKGFVARHLRAAHSIIYAGSCDSFDLSAEMIAAGLVRDFISFTGEVYFGLGDGLNSVSAIFDNMAGARNDLGNYSNQALEPLLPVAQRSMDAWYRVIVKRPPPIIMLRKSPSVPDPGQMRLYNAPRIVRVDVAADPQGNSSFSQELYRFIFGNDEYPYNPGSNTDYPSGGVKTVLGTYQYGELQITLRFSEPMRSRFPEFQVSLIPPGGGSRIPFTPFAGQNGWSNANLPDLGTYDTWVGRLSGVGEILDGEGVISVRASRQVTLPPLDLQSQELDLDGDGKSVTNAEDVSTTVVFDRRPPSLRVWNSEGDLHYAVTQDPNVHVRVARTAAPLNNQLEFFRNGESQATVTPGTSFDGELSPKSWYWVRACDIASSCTLVVFGIFPPGSSPTPAPEPPSPTPGKKQTMPPPPNSPPNTGPVPPSPPQGPYQPPKPPPNKQACTSAQPDLAKSMEGCMKSPPAPQTPWKPTKFCKAYPNGCPHPYIGFSHDPNAKQGPDGPVVPGQLMTYTIEFENEGAGNAVGVFVKDTLDLSLDDSTLVLRDFRHVDYLAESETPAQFPWTYDSRTRTATVMAGDFGSRKGGRFVLEARLKAGATPGTIISNTALVHFPNALEITPTNAVVSAVPLPTQLAYGGASSGTAFGTGALQAILTGGGRALSPQAVEFALASSTYSAVTDVSGTASAMASLLDPPGAYRTAAQYKGDGFYYLPSSTSHPFTIAKRSTRLQPPYGSAAINEPARVVVTLTDDQGQPLALQQEEPKTLHLELLHENGPPTLLVSALLTGTSTLFEFSLPQPLSLSWPIRARFDGDSRYDPSSSTGTLALLDGTAPTISILSPTGGQSYGSSGRIPIDFELQDDADPTPAASAYLVSAEGGESFPVTDGEEVPASSLSPGRWALWVDASDWAGNGARAVSPAFKVLSDALPPRTTSYIGAPSYGTEPIFVGTRTPVGFRAVDDLSTSGDGLGVGIARTEYALDGGPSTIFTEDFTISTEGPHSLTFFSVDLAGNAEVSQTRALNVDSTPPSTALLVNGSTAVASQLIIISTDSLSVAASDAGVGAGQTLFALDGGSQAIFAQPFSLEAGAHAIVFQSVDHLGNLEPSRRVDLTVVGPDQTPPALTLSLVDGSTISTATPLIVVSFSDELSAVDAGSLRLSLDGVDVTSQAAVSASSASFAPAAALAQGAHTLEASVADVYGNTTSLSAAFSVDTLGPTVALGSPAGPGFCGVVSGQVPVTGSVQSPDLREWRLEAAPGRDAASGFTPIASGSAAVGGTLATWDTAALSGWQTLRLSAADSGGNVSSSQSSLFVGAPARVLLIGGDKALNKPRGAAVAPGRILVADTNNDRVQVYDSSAAFIASYGLQGRRIEPWFSKPRGVAMSDGSLFIADTQSHRVVKLSATGEIQLELGRRTQSKGVKQFQPGSGPGEFKQPAAVALDASGHIFVGDAGNARVQVFTSSGALARIINLPAAPPLTETGEEEPAAALGLALDSAGRLYVADAAGRRLLKYGPQGESLSTIEGVFARPEGVAVSPGGECVVVSDRETGKIHKFDAEGRATLVFATGELNKPAGLALDESGRLLVADRNNDRLVGFAAPGADPVVAAGDGKGYRAASLSSGSPASKAASAKLGKDGGGGRVLRADRAGVELPRGALDAETEITVTSVDYAHPDAGRQRDRMEVLGLKAAAEPVEFGPEGLAFSLPVTISLPYDAGVLESAGLRESSLKIHYWNPQVREWEPLDSVIDSQTRVVSARTSHFSLYQVLGLSGGGPAPAAQVLASADATFRFVDLYVFPNPARGSAQPTIRAQVGLADSVEVNLYDVSGRKVHGATLSGPQILDDGNGKGFQYTYDLTWDTSGVGSGVYYFVLTARKGGQPDIRKTGRVGVIR